jgi:hypothetical protein
VKINEIIFLHWPESGAKFGYLIGDSGKVCRDRLRVSLGTYIAADFKRIGYLCA